MTVPRSILIGLLAIAFSVLVLANEVRYQGCVSNVYRAVEAIAIADEAITAPPECARIPFTA